MLQVSFGGVSIEIDGAGSISEFSPRAACVYRILNTKNGREYIGSTSDVTNRLNKHRGKLKNGNHSITDLQKDYNLFGIDSFSFEIIRMYNVFCKPQICLEEGRIINDAIVSGRRPYNKRGTSYFQEHEMEKNFTGEKVRCKYCLNLIVKEDDARKYEKFKPFCTKGCRMSYEEHGPKAFGCQVSDLVGG